MGNQTVTQGIITDAETFNANQGVERIALFDGTGRPVDLAALQTGEDTPLTGYEIAVAYTAIADTDTINEAIGKLEAKADSDGQDGSEVLLTGYEIDTSYTAIAATDTVNEAIGKVEYLATTPYEVALTGYVIDGTGGALAATDTILEAIAKLEKRVDVLENP